MAALRLSLLTLLLLFSASIGGRKRTGKKASDIVTAQTPDGRMLHPTKEKLKSFKEHDVNGDGYIKRKVSCGGAFLTCYTL